MPEIINIYCDESCHTEKDRQRYMVLGALWCPQSAVEEAGQRLKDLRKVHHVFRRRELKSTQISPSRQHYYAAILDYFFDNTNLNFRAVIADKSMLRHNDFAQTHEDWYYKMFFCTLNVILNPEKAHHIYIDYKDSNSPARVAKLHDVLCNSMYDFPRKIIEKVQPVRSHEVALLQLSDFLTGLLSYHARGLDTNAVKNGLVSRMQQRSGLSLSRNSLYRAEKVNLLCWPTGQLQKA